MIGSLRDGIAAHNAAPPPTDVQKAELEHRLAEHQASPDDVVSWTEVKAFALARIGNEIGTAIAVSEMAGTRSVPPNP